MKDKVIVREVGLRDGLQIHPTFMPTESKLAWIAAEAAAGVSEIEVTSYVPPKLIPQFADAAEVTAGALKVPGLMVAALIPNLKGAERGIALGVKKLNFVMSVSHTHNLKNVRREPDESVADFRQIVALIKNLPKDQRPIITGGLSTALGCSYEGRVAVAAVVKRALQLMEAGADELVVADTVGYADPIQVREVFRAVLKEVGTLPVAAHFHDTRGQGLANVLAALEEGVDSFESSFGELGGCPVPPGATGNVATEDLVSMISEMGIETGVNLPALIAASAAAQEILGRPLGSHVLRAGPVDWHPGA
jgi:hydroxymethylglutaryl-CoA lyase